MLKLKKITVILILIFIASCSFPKMDIDKHVILESGIDSSKEIKELKFRKFSSIEGALNDARKENKSVLLYFTGYAVLNSQIMDEKILIDKEVQSIINNKYIAFSLFVDSREKLDETYISKKTGKSIETVGGKLFELQLEKFNSNKQPYFVIIDEKGVIKREQYYTSNMSEFIKFLKLE